MSFLRNIVYTMPDSPAARVFTDNLFSLLKITNLYAPVNLDKDTKPDYSPATFFSLSANIKPAIIFSDEAMNSIEVCNFKSAEKIYEEGPCITIVDFWKRLGEAEISIDHTGVNLPTKLYSKSEFNTLIHKLAQKCVVFEYPGEDWPFVVPSTQSEINGDIVDLQVWRGPKFELVYDRYTSAPLIQFSISTDLSKEQVHNLFPGPYAETFPNLADFFRSVYIESPWRGIRIRFDVNYSSDQTEDGLLKYLVIEGKRLY